MSLNSKKLLREMGPVSSKRARSTEDDSDSELEAPSRLKSETHDSTSEWEETSKAKKKGKPPAKRQKVEKIEKVSPPKRSKTDTVVHGQIINKIPDWARGNDGTPMFTQKWWKEVTTRDAFWDAFSKNVPKTVKAKRLLVTLAVDLDDAETKKEDGASTVKTGRGPKKSASGVGNGSKLEKVEPRKSPTQSSMSDDSDDDFGTDTVKSTVDTSPSKRQTSSSTQVLEASPRKSILEIKQTVVESNKAVNHVDETEDDEECVIVGSSPSKHVGGHSKASNSPKKAETSPTKKQVTNITHAEVKTADNDVSETFQEDTVVVASPEPRKEAGVTQNVSEESGDMVHQSIEKGDGQNNTDPASDRVN